MARIRSIKPDFFTSEKIASLPLSARLLFVGLWTHVDDNGVTVDNERLINAAIWPLEDDPLEALQRTREDLRRLSTARLIVRYEAAGKALLFIAGWDEHQKVSHPAKPRYPRPTPEQMSTQIVPVNSADATLPEPVTDSSGDSPEDLQRALEIFGPEQGAGSREQGKEMPPPAAEPPARRDAPAETTITQRSKLITDAYAAVEPMCKWPAINGIVIKAIKAEKWSDDEIRAALLRLADEGRTVTVETLRRELAGDPPPESRAPSRNQPSNGSGSQMPPRDADYSDPFRRKKSA
ncbi:hypothetical protein [Microbispora sp. KK1-11]|uniref:hypothetical protein n=1 Tax=Microbispora sp. KK1-11 TaxID=2053005 RepID=UPI0011598CC9|nr:hypothetical protein [Microbispora sp. KK1-11]TQS30018.1 hypothetical protein FLW16_06560 [Microbispora sp. KK1-11]